jgi:hypothetical protein
MQSDVVVVLFAACATPSRVAEPLSSQHAPVASLEASSDVFATLELVAMPPLPARHRLDVLAERACRAHLEVARGFVDDTHEDLRRLVRVAIETGGDCRIEADDLLAERAARRIGGCTGTSPEIAIEQWALVAAVGSTHARRAAAQRNVATLAMWIADYTDDAARWITAGDAFVKAVALDRDDQTLSAAAVESYLRAVTQKKLAPEQKAHAAHMLERIVDGAAGDRARLLRARL